MTRQPPGPTAAADSVPAPWRGATSPAPRRGAATRHGTWLPRGARQPLRTLGRAALAMVRSLAQVGLGVAGLVLAMVVVVGATLVVTYPAVATLMSWLANLGRRLAGGWGGVPIAASDRGGPPAPRRREDGWYVHDNQLFRSPRMPALLARIQWHAEDPAASRDWLWLATTPFVGGLATAIPPALAGAGVVVALDLLGVAPAPWGLATPVGLLLVPLGLALAPGMLRVHAWWSRVLLGPPELSWWRTSGVGPWLGQRYRAVWHGAGLAGLSFAAFGGFLANLLAAALSWGMWVPTASSVTRRQVEFYRHKVRAWTGVEIERPYRPYPPPPVPGADGLYRSGRSLYSNRQAATRAQRDGWIRADPATWRDLAWMATSPVLGVVGLLPAVLVAFGAFGLFWQPLWWAPWAVPIGLASGVWVTPWYVWYALTLGVPSLSAVPGWVSPLVGLAMAGLGVLLVRPLGALRLRLDRLLLAPTNAAVLASRVRRLTQTRTDVVDAQAAELRRIERDLHDGAQARLVAVGLSLATIEELMERDPAAARTLLAQARETSAAALTELRDLVRGIHPPVLAERGLGDAVRAVALDCTLPVDVRVDLPGALDAPVESAAYFAVLEALTNAVRHSGATRVEIDLSHQEGLLRIVVTDDGRGGADVARGTGLRGIQRRLATFDGVLGLDSPPGGPTVLTMELACALSSPKTSTSSGMA